ncbi:UNVERIFIED_CONTAM: Plasmodesmata-located protein 2 [Sesamum radiatum]|uniref:Plasmodesmata-located protein 2 n=1 Tax=Sesamum radiatum TaxID=300843 RepID=A0AAW2W7T7_SESRA
MGPSQSLILSLSLTVFSILASASASDYTNLVFKGCADQNFQNFNGFYKQTLQNLLDTLTSKSSAAKFYNATSGDGSSAIDGLFQCRGDLSNDDCNNCVKRAESLAQKLCGQAVAARVQLNACYLRLDTALEEIVKGLGSGNSAGFYAAGFQSVYVLGQCEGDLDGGECVNCVKNAIDSAKSECSSSISAQIYLQQCYISYTYYPNGVPNNQKSLSSSGTGRNTQKTVAIVLGGLVGAGLGHIDNLHKF